MIIEIFNEKTIDLDIRSLRICRAVQSEADLDLTCLHRVIYGSDNEDVNTAHFNLITQPEVNRAEASELEEMYRRLNDTYQKLSKTSSVNDDNEESMCIICYSHRIQVTFRPCKHQSCL